MEMNQLLNQLFNRYVVCQAENESNKAVCIDGNIPRNATNSGDDGLIQIVTAEIGETGKVSVEKR